MTLHAEVRTAAAPPATPLDNLVELLRVDLAEVEKLLAEVEKSLVTDVLSAFFVSSDREIGKPVAVPERSLTIG